MTTTTPCLLKNGAFLTAENNTIVGCTVAAISFDETNRTVNPGRGALMDGCIFWNNAALFQHLYINDPVETNTDLTIVRSLVQGTNHPGVGNINGDPLFVNNTSDFHLRPGVARHRVRAERPRHGRVRPRGRVHQRRAAGP
jgi:hypothetical protein